MLTIEGASSWSRTVGAMQSDSPDLARWRAELESRGILFIRDDLFVGSTHPDFYHSTVHAPWYVFEHWTRFFELLAYLPEGSDTQDLVVLRRRPDGAAAPRPIGHRDVRTSQVDQVRPVMSWGRWAIAALRRARDLRPSSEPFDLIAIERELNMLRSGLYEQGKRMSVLAAELRAEIESARRGEDDPT
jgi:hypothetical protein